MLQTWRLAPLLLVGLVQTANSSTDTVYVDLTIELIIGICNDTQICSLQVGIAIRPHNRKLLPVHSSITSRSTAQRCAAPSAWILPTVELGMGTWPSGLPSLSITSRTVGLSWASTTATRGARMTFIRQGWRFKTACCLLLGRLQDPFDLKHRVLEHTWWVRLVGR
jgi:hypothetical protein